MALFKTLKRQAEQDLKGSNGLLVAADKVGGRRGAKKWAAFPSTEAFMKWYFKQQQRFCYEQLCKDTECKIYFDIDLARKNMRNERQWSEIKKEYYAVFRNTMKECVRDILAGVYNYMVPGELPYVLVTSSTDDKISEHFIFNIPMKNLREMKHMFKTYFLPYVSEKLKSSILEPVLFCDGCVYNERPFRFVFSSKLGQNRPLKPEYVGLIKQGMPKEKIFELAMVHSKTWYKDMLPLGENNSATGNVTGGDFTYSKVNENDANKIRQVCETICGKGSVAAIEGRDYVNFKGNTRRTVGVRFHKGKIVCPNIGRPHGSNHMYAIIDMETKQMRMQCMDPACNKHRFGITRANRSKRQALGQDTRQKFIF